MKSHALPIVASVAGAAFIGGCVTREVVVERPVPAPYPAPVGVPSQPADTVLAQPVPAPQPQPEVITVAPGPDYIWIAGYYEWDAPGRWVWIAGHWDRPAHAHAIWVSPGWRSYGRGYRWERGRWR